MKETEKDNIKQIYTNYLSKEQIQCNDQEEIDKIIKHYKETGETIPGYNIESDDLGNIIVWKDTMIDRSIDELKAKLSIENAKNIRTIKNCILFITILIIIDLIAIIIWILINNN